MATATRTRPPDVAGNLEVRQLNGGQWHIVYPPGAGPEYTIGRGLPRKRTAVAVRALLLAEVPDWAVLAAAHGILALPDGEVGDRVRRVGRMVGLVVARASRGCCLGCGCRPGACECGTDEYADGPHYTAEQLAWFR